MASAMLRSAPRLICSLIKGLSDSFSLSHPLSFSLSLSICLSHSLSPSMSLTYTRFLSLNSRHNIIWVWHKCYSAWLSSKSPRGSLVAEKEENELIEGWGGVFISSYIIYIYILLYRRNCQKTNKNKTKTKIYPLNVEFSWFVYSENTVR